MIRREMTLLALVAITLSGCIRRTELIQVNPDGTVRMMTRFEGDPSDIRQGDAFPSRQAGWTVTEKTEQDGSKEKLILTAEREMHLGEAFPETYLDANDNQRGKVLGFKTSVSVEQRDEGTYYHFRREYLERQWTRFDFGQRELMESDDVRKLTSEDPASLTPEQRAQIADSIVEAEGRKTLALVDYALERQSQQIPQDVRLAIRSAVAEVFEQGELREAAVKLLTQSEPSPDGDAINERLQREIMTALTSTAKAKGTNEQTVDLLRENYEFIRDYHAISEDLGDEVWAVGVQLPGRIIAQNGNDKEALPLPADSDASDRKPFTLEVMEEGFARGVDRCGWSFEGKALYDRDVVLMATSFVPKGE